MTGRGLDDGRPGRGSHSLARMPSDRIREQASVSRAGPIGRGTGRTGMLDDRVAAVEVTCQPVRFEPTYDGSESEPKVLPAADR